MVQVKEFNNLFLEDSGWDVIHALVIVVGALVSLSLGDTMSLFVIALVSFIYFITLNKEPKHTFLPFRTYANWVTAIRLLLLLLIIAIWPSLHTTLLISALILIVALDRVDGHLARRFKQESLWGRAFDVEVDSLFVLFCCVYLIISHAMPLWLIIPGLMRYSYIIILKVINPSVQKERSNKIASYVAGMFYLSLLWSIADQSNLQQIVLMISSILIVVSFLISYYYLWLDNKHPIT